MDSILNVLRNYALYLIWYAVSMKWVLYFYPLYYTEQSSVKIYLANLVLLQLILDRLCYYIRGERFK